MWKRDLRLHGLANLVNNATLQKYRDAVAEHPYAGLPAVVAWLAELLANFPSTVDKSAVSGQLRDGDQHYASVFLRLNLLPEDRDPTLPIEPLSDCVDQIIESITGRRLRGDSNAPVFGFLKEAVLTDLARFLARDNRYSLYSQWEALINRFWQSDMFYEALVSAIPKSAIQQVKASLTPPYDNSNVVRYLSQGDKRMEDDVFQREYLKRIEKNRLGAPAEFIRKLTDHSDTMSLHRNQVLKKDLVRQLGRDAEVAWIDGLRWPLVQAAALNEYGDVSEIAAMVAELVQQRDKLQSPFVHLLLIMLEQAIGVMRRISFNLHQFEQPAGQSYHNSTILEELHAEGQNCLAAWKAHEIRTLVTDLLKSILAIENPTDELQRGLFGWVAGQDRERWLNNPHADSVLKTIDELHEQYLNSFTSGKWSKAQLIQTIAMDLIDWKQFKLLYSLWNSEETDETLRSKLIDKMNAYIRSDLFSWNTAYVFDNYHLNQALQLTNLYFRLPDSEMQLAALTKAMRTWNEGWSYRGASGMKDSNRYIFLLTCGMCRSYLHYDAGDVAGATANWKSYLEETTVQYRSARSELDRQYYLLPLKLLFHIVQKFDEFALPNLLDETFGKIDHIENRIELAHSLMETTTFLKKTLNVGTRQDIRGLLQAQWWVLELQLKRTKHVEHNRQFEKLYNAVLPWLTTS